MMPTLEPGTARVAYSDARPNGLSTFSAEVVALLQQCRMALAGGIIAIHVIGSVTMTLLGIGPYALANGA